jgi:hypothetical protein
MNVLEFSSLLFGTAIFAGLLGALTGLGVALSSYLLLFCFLRSTFVTRSEPLWYR